MKPSNPGNSQLFATLSSGQKRIPLAIFAVIALHVFLFILLLVAAGVRAASRRGQAPSESRPEPAQATAMISGEPAGEAPGPVRQPVAPMVRAAEPVFATDPPAEPQPTPPERATPARVSSATASPDKFYIVKAGDNLARIAKVHRTTVQALKEENRLTSDRIRAGQKLRVGGEIRKGSREV